MVSSLVPGALIASARAALPLPDSAADALWALTAPIHCGESRRFLALASNERHWRVLAGLYDVDPRLALLGVAIGARLAAAHTDRPVRALRQSLAGIGVSGALWRDLVRQHLPAIETVFESRGALGLIAHLRLSSTHGALLPIKGPAGDWVAQFQLDSVSSTTWHLAAARWRLSPALALRVLREGLARFDADTFTLFSEAELPVVAAWHTYLGSGAARAKWSTLFARAKAAEAEEERSLLSEGQCWETGMTTQEFAGIHVTALSDGVALWREGLRMHHCVGDYSARCVSGVNQVFHLDTGDSSKGWTLALRADGHSGWNLDDLRGIQNALPPAPLKFWAKEWAQAYGEIFESDPSVLDDERPEICMICREEHCNAHHVLSTDTQDGILGGAFDGEDKSLGEDLKSDIASMLLSGEKPPSHWPSEWTSIYDALAEIPKDELFDLIEEEDEEPRWESGDAFYDAWLETDAQRVLVSWIEEWAMAQSGTHSKYTEISTAPGLSWAGWNVYATDPNAVLKAFRAELARLFQSTCTESTTESS